VSTNQMPSQHSSDVKLEIGHALFADIVGYLKLLIHLQSERRPQLNEIVRRSEAFCTAKKSGKTNPITKGRWDGPGLVCMKRKARRWNK